MVARRTLTSLGVGAALLAISSGAATAQDCVVRCITIHQFFDDQIAATFVLKCDREAIICWSAGKLRVNGTDTPVNVATSYLRATPRHWGLPKEARLLAIRFEAPSSDPARRYDAYSSINMPLSKARNQHASFELSWTTLHYEGGKPKPAANSEKIPGIIKIIVQNYAPAPSPGVWPMRNNMW